MKMLKIIIAVLILSMGSNAVFSNNKHWNGALTELRIEKMQRNLDLNNKQVDKLQSISKKYSQGTTFRSMKKTLKSLYKLNPNSKGYKKQLKMLADNEAESVKAKVLSVGGMRAEIYKVLTLGQQKKMQSRMKKNNCINIEKRKV